MTAIMVVSQPTKPAAHIWDRTCAFLHVHLHPIAFHNISQATTSGSEPGLTRTEYGVAKVASQQRKRDEAERMQ
jgi:hypothetical protein